MNTEHLLTKQIGTQPPSTRGNFGLRRKMSAHLEITDDIAVLNLGDDENRFSPDWLTTVNGYLDRI